MNEASESLRLVVRALAAGAFTVLMVSFPFYFSAWLLIVGSLVNSIVAGLIGGDRVYAFSIGAALLFEASFLLLTVLNGSDGEDPLFIVALTLVLSVAIGLAAAALVQLFRRIVRRVKP